MRNKFDNELRELNNNLVLMGALCETAISMSVKAFLDGNNTYGKEAIALEKEIDGKEKDIEQQCLKLLLQQQPVAKDLRVISAALKMITDLERIGDQAQDIAELSQYTSTSMVNANIKRMAEESVKMVTDAVDSYVKRDLTIAKRVVIYDDVVDGLFYEVKCDIIKALKEERYDEEACIDILMIAKYLERIADHATNVAEWVVFSITGTHKED